MLLVLLKHTRVPGWRAAPKQAYSLQVASYLTYGL